MEKKKEYLRKRFIEYYGPGGKIYYFFSPGRVNLIGEHIDYNGGMVFPFAISLGIYAVVRYNSQNILRLRSLELDGEIQIELDKDIVFSNKDGWGNYPKGVVRELLPYYSLRGGEILLSSSLPLGVGLSSSAALEILIAYILLYPFQKNIDRIALAKYCQKAENDFVGVKCGIMDQFCVAMGKKEHAIFLNCQTLEYEYIPLHLSPYSLLILNTNKKRELSNSKYNERRKECRTIVKILQEHISIENLCEAKIEQLKQYIQNPILLRRGEHVITENQRVWETKEVLTQRNIKALGKLLIESHNSLKNSYEVTGIELDTIVEEALKIKGCIGARMTGAGFGGVAIALVHYSNRESFQKQLIHSYSQHTGLIPECYPITVSDGVHWIDMEEI